jgi:hypothetical protein
LIVGHHHRLHLHTEISASAPRPLLNWLAGTGSTSDLLAALPAEEADWLSGLTDSWRDSFDMLLEPRSHHGDRVVDYRLMVSTLVKDDDVMITYGLPAALAPYAAEGLIGLSWTDQHQQSDATLFLVQQGRLYVAQRFGHARHLPLNGVEETPWTPFPRGDPEADLRP